ncbi:MAG: DUF262 domain-containing protein [Lachnospiraceae bacterium]|nr:DUF262 domain-containing protein [Lachnospiraceae bacterium]
MNRRKRTTGDNLDVGGRHILDMWNSFEKGIFLVSRKYQRKLVWTLEEKQNFIDTILHKYPIPLFLLVGYKDKNNEYHEDIIDGLQRLNAIFSFIKGEFAVSYNDHYSYFNYDAMYAENTTPSDTMKPVIDYKTCREFLLYKLPVTITEADDTTVEDIFKRINSTGRKLSKQDLRQAGAVGAFSDLVRKTASYVRGDYTTSDVIPLNEMPDISLSNSGLKYKIKIKNVFWNVHDICTFDNIRISQDEEIIARILSYIILGNNISPSSKKLDEIYEPGSSIHKELDNAVQEKGIGQISDYFSKIYTDFKKIFESVNSTFSDWLFDKATQSGKAKIFQALFLALHELRSSNYYISDYEQIANAIYKIGKSKFRDITEDRNWTIKIRNEAIQQFVLYLKPKMVLKKLKNEDIEWKLKFEDLLDRAVGIEQQMYDFKLGLTVLKDGTRNPKIISKIVKTLTAMANTNPDEDGVIIIGVADDANAAKDYQKHYNSSWIENGKCFITGINDEIKKYWGNLESYVQYLKQEISRQPIQDDVKSQILNNFKIIEYEERIIIIIKCKNNGHSFTYDSEFYERRGSNTEKVQIGSPSFNELIKRTTK